MKTQKVFFISLVVFIIFLFVVPNSFIPNDLGNAILTVLAFLFGIIAGFCIVVTTTDFNTIKTILASETAGWTSLYQNFLIYDKTLAKKLSSHIDAYIIRNFDLEVIDSTKATQTEFEIINKFVRELPLPIKSELSSTFEGIQNTMNDMIIARQQLVVLGKKTI